MSIEAMKLALEALLSVWEDGEAITALRAAIEQAEKQYASDKTGSACPEFWDWLPKAYNYNGVGRFTKYNMEVAFLAGKQSVEQAEKQEPVAWFVYIPSQQCGEYFDSEDDCDLVGWMTNYPDAELTKLYTAPPQREWVGLTDEEIEDLYFDRFSMGELDAFARAIEAKLKEKNQ